MKTIETIIERLSKRPSNNGCYAVLQLAVEDLEKASTDMKDLPLSAEIVAFMRSREKHGTVFSKTTGFLWGLRATDFISKEEFDAAFAELMEV